MWRHVAVPGSTVAVAERDALGTDARLAVWPPDSLMTACGVADGVLAALDQQASRFRADSEISALHRFHGGLFALSDGLAEAIGVALAAARWTGGLTDPTVGAALICLGYDRDFAAIGTRAGTTPTSGVPGPAPGWEQVRLDGRLLSMPGHVRLDLGATAKGLGADRAARAAVPNGGGILVSLGGDIAVAGTPPKDGWPVTVGGPGGPLIRLAAGGVATSSVTCRRWQRDGQDLHHIIDPRTGRPAGGPWRMVTVAAATCADANAAATAAIVAGAGAAHWLARTGLPARLVSHDGRVHLTAGWPGEDGAAVPVPHGSRIYPLGGPR